MSRGLAFSSSCPSGQRRRSLHSFFRTASKTLSSSIGLGVTTYTAVLQPCVLHSNRTRRVTQSMLGSCSDEVSALYTEANPQERQPIAAFQPSADQPRGAGPGRRRTSGQPLQRVQNCWAIVSIGCRVYHGSSGTMRL